MAGRNRHRKGDPRSESARAHEHALDCCIGSALRDAVAMALGQPDASIGQLERACGFLTEEGARPSGAIRGWLKGHLPLPATIRLVRARTGERVDLEPVVGHPLFELARWTEPNASRTKEIMQKLQPQLRCDDFVGASPGPELAYVPDARLCQRLRDTGTMAAFAALLALARRAEHADEESEHFGPAQAAYDLWPRVVASTWVRRTDWISLTRCLHAVLWNRAYSGGLMLGTSLDKLIENIRNVLDDDRHQYPLRAGATRSEWDDLLARVGVVWLDLAREADRTSSAAAHQAARELEGVMRRLRRIRNADRRRVRDPSTISRHATHEA